MNKKRQSLIYADFYWKYLDKYFIQVTLRIVGVVAFAIVVLLGVNYYMSKEAKALQSESDYINSIQNDIASTSSELSTIDSSLSYERQNQAKWKSDPEENVANFPIQDYMTFLESIRPKGLAILSMECNNEKLLNGGKDNTLTTNVDQDGQTVASEETDMGTGETTSSSDDSVLDVLNEAAQDDNNGIQVGDISTSFGPNADGQWVDYDTNYPVDSSGMILSTTPVSSSDSDSMPNDSMGMGSAGSDSDSNVNETTAKVLLYDKDLSGSDMIIKGYANSMVAVSQFIYALNEDTQYVAKYELAGAQESFISDDLTLIVFKIKVTLINFGASSADNAFEEPSFNDPTFSDMDYMDPDFNEPTHMEPDFDEPSFREPDLDTLDSNEPSAN